jgi:hypothetical protein
MLLKNSNPTEQLLKCGFVSIQKLPHRNLLDKAPGRVAVFCRAEILEEDKRFFTWPTIKEAKMWLKVTKIEENNQNFANTHFILVI